jgi:acyl-CoA thioesterase II
MIEVDRLLGYVRIYRVESMDMAKWTSRVSFIQEDHQSHNQRRLTYCSRPGGVLMAFGAAAAYETLSKDWSINTLQSYFLLGPSPRTPFQLKVQRLSDGGRFATRAVEVQQSGKLVCHVTCR